MTWLVDLDYACGSNRLGSRMTAGGEWDGLRAVPANVRRRLVGAGLIHPRGMAPDQLAQVVSERWRPMTPDEVIDWYIYHALRQLEHNRLERYRRTYRRRDAAARAAGWRSFYARRRWRELHRLEVAA